MLCKFNILHYKKTMQTVAQNSCEIWDRNMSKGDMYKAHDWQ